jgi:hypothetical protein
MVATAGDSSAARRPAVLHLVWAPLGPAPLGDFLASYHKHQAGVEHDLVIALNGANPGATDGRAATKELLSELEGTEHRLCVLECPSLDLDAYRQAVEILDHDRVCVLNSYSRVLCDGWLAKLDSALSASSVGIVGATGSWASSHSYALFHLGLPSEYRRVYPHKAATIAQFEALQPERSPATHWRLRRSFDTTRALVSTAIRFPPFPASHLRTNAFMAGRELLLRVLPAGVADKPGTYRLESGRASITRTVQSAGLRVLVVDRFGRSFEPENWSESRTFWQGDQEGLLVADNQTDLYQYGDDELRLLLSRYAWGERAAPGKPR